MRSPGVCALRAFFPFDFCRRKNVVNGSERTNNEHKIREYFMLITHAYFINMYHVCTLSQRWMVWAVRTERSLRHLLLICQWHYFRFCFHLWVFLLWVPLLAMHTLNLSAVYSTHTHTWLWIWIVSHIKNEFKTEKWREKRNKLRRVARRLISSAVTRSLILFDSNDDGDDTMPNGVFPPRVHYH